MLTKIKHNLLIITGFIIILISCNPNRLYHENYVFSDYKWQSDEQVTFKPNFSTEDVSKNYQIQFNIRYIQGFQNKYLNLLITVTRPDGSQAEKEESIQIREDNGDYIGDGAGSYWDLDYEIKDNFEFDQQGEYIIDILPIIEKEPVYFINELGLSIIKTDK